MQQALVDEADALVQGMHLGVARVGLDDDAPRERVGELIGENAAHHFQAEAVHRALAGDEQQVHAAVTGAHLVVVGEAVVGRVIALEQERRLAVAHAEGNVAMAAALDFVDVIGQLSQAQMAHGPEARVVAAQPVMQ